MENKKNKPLKVRLNEVDYYTREGAIVQFGFSESTLKREVGARRLQVLRHPMGWLFEKAWIDDWFSRRTQKPLKKFQL